MKKRFLMFICLVMAVATMLPVTAFAEENTQSEENSYCYFIDGVQVEQDEYHQYTQGYVQMKQADKPASPALELENTFDYYIVNADDIKKVTENEYHTTLTSMSQTVTRATGSWYIKDSVIKASQTKYYYQTNGDKFSVGSDEYIELTIDAANHVRSFGVGYGGTSYQKEYIDLPQNRGAIVAFIDDIEVPGSYYVFIENSGKDTETVNGDIAVKKR